VPDLKAKCSLTIMAAPIELPSNISGQNVFQPSLEQQVEALASHVTGTDHEQQWNANSCVPRSPTRFQLTNTKGENTMQKAKILVVETIPIWVRAMRLRLRANNYESLPASDAP